MGRAGRLIGLVAALAGLAAPAAAAPAGASVASLQKAVDAAYRQAAELYDADLLDARPGTGPLAGIKAQWAARLRRCGDDSCRRRLLGDQLGRLAYGLGRSARPLAGLPWRHGRFTPLPRQGFSGRLDLLPAIDDRIIVHVQAQAPGARWECGFVATGRWRGGGAELTSAEGWRFRLGAGPGGRIVLGLGKGVRGDGSICSNLGAAKAAFRPAP
jgi:hypothetical protein